ncbi:MAG: hypothetical protein KDC54_08265 [Lewinella sp.]|nr:hypothetical protein [Lewinella sp.]
MRKEWLWTLLTAALIGWAACQSEGDRGGSASEAEAVDLKKELPGAWQTIRINVAVNTADGRDTFVMNELTEEVWSRAFGMQPPVYYFQPDQKYRVEHRTLNDDLFSLERGIWNVFGDTLMLITDSATYQYRVRLRDGMASFRGFRDWDEDGQEDDEYQGVFRLIGLDTSE